jgi:nucleotide-binding universal stress UspA family protein
MLLPIDKILCPVDLSDLSLVGLRAGLELAGRLGAEVTALHVLAPVPIGVHTTGRLPAFEVPGYEAEVKAARERELSEMIDELDLPPARRGIVRQVRLGPAAEEIVVAAEEGDFDLIVIYAHGETGLKRLALGSVAERVVRLAQPPVLCIHPQEEVA